MARRVAHLIVLSLARLLDLSGAMIQPPAAVPDTEAMREDWQLVGDDLRDAMREVRSELSESSRDQLEHALAEVS